MNSEIDPETTTQIKIIRFIENSTYCLLPCFRFYDKLLTMIYKLQRSYNNGFSNV